MSAAMEMVTVVPTGSANLASVRAALGRARCEVVFATTAADIDSATRLVLPGVGAFAAAVTELRSKGLFESLRKRVHDRRPTLAICLGLQLLCEGSEEAPGVEGLGCIPGQIRRFGDDLRVPQLGWNRVESPEDAVVMRSGDAYFAHSYRLTDGPPGWLASETDHGGRFVSALESGPVLACQFHPELSSQFGRGWIERWLATTSEVRSAC